MKSIKTKLIISFSVLILSVTLTIGLFALQIGYRSLKVDAEYSLKSLSTEGAKLVESRMESVISILKMIAMKNEIKNMGWEVDLEILKEELIKTEFIDIGFVLPNGYTYYTDGTVRLMSDRTYIIDALDGNAKISDVVISRVTKKPEIEVAVPVLLDGEVVGALVGRMEADALSEITKDIGYGDNGYSFMINELGTIIAHPNRDKVIERYNPIKESKENPDLNSMANAFKRMLDKKTGVLSFTDEEDSLYAGYTPIEGTDWRFVITADENEIMSAIPKMIRMIVSVMLIVFACSLGIVFLLDNTLTRPLIEMTKQSKRIGDLDIRDNIPEVYLKHKDEIGTLSGAFQILAESLRNIIADLLKSANEVSDTAQKLTASSQQTAITSETISSSIGEIAKGALEQANNTEIGMEQVILLGETIEINHQFMLHLNSTTEQVTGFVNNGLKDIENLIAMTNENDLATKDICDVILQVKQSSEQIGDASRVITDMAEQTNLLALNASIEAARAGEFGKGFSIVAEEIKKLADQSADSTKHIDSIIMELQNKIKKAVESMSRISITSVQQHKSVSDTIQKYQDISEAMKNSEKAVVELNNSEKDMEKASNQIKNMLQALSAIAEQNAASTQQAAATMQEQTASVQVVAEISDYLTELAENLRNTVTRFKIN